MVKIHLQAKRPNKKSVYQLNGVKRWWPRGLGDPTASGHRDNVRYAFFPQHRRLLVEIDGVIAILETQELQIWGMARGGERFVLNTQRGRVELQDLRTTERLTGPLTDVVRDLLPQVAARAEDRTPSRVT